MSQVQPIPEGFRTVTPNLVVDGGAKAIDFYERAFGAEVTARLEAGGMLVHAAVRIGDSLVTLCDPMPSHGMAAPDHEAPVTSFITLYVEDADALHAQALAAGATEINPIADHIHGDRAGSVRDPSATAGRSPPHRGRLGGGAVEAHGGVRLMSEQAIATFEITAWEPEPYDEPAEGQPLTRITVRS